MSISDKISLASAIISFFAVIVAIVTSTISIRQSNKNIALTKEINEEANRPYIVSYYNGFYAGGFETYLTVKNFGKTGATIDSISYTPSKKIKWRETSNYSSNFFSDLNNYFFAPNQVITIPCYLDGEENYVFTIKYHTRINNYAETISLNPNVESPFRSTQSKLNDGSKFEQYLIDYIKNIYIKNL